jgi:hypothetical protein
LERPALTIGDPVVGEVAESNRKTLPLLLRGAKLDVYTGRFRMVSGVPAVRAGCQRYCPVLSLSFPNELHRRIVHDEDGIFPVRCTKRIEEINQLIGRHCLVRSGCNANFASARSLENAYRLAHAVTDEEGFLFFRTHASAEFFAM